MNTQEAIAKKNSHVRTAKALGTVAVALGKAAKTKAKDPSMEAAVKQAARLLDTLAKRMQAEVELASLYDSFAQEIEEPF